MTFVGTPIAASWSFRPPVGILQYDLGLPLPTHITTRNDDRRTLLGRGYGFRALIAYFRAFRTSDDGAADFSAPFGSSVDTFARTRRQQLTERPA
jgi:hypothetical protein